MSLNFVVRPYSNTDRALVADSWLNSLRAGTEESKVADWQAFKASKNAMIDRILDDKRTYVRIAAPADDELTIYGYLVSTPTTPAVVHMLFVKKPFRRQGVATRLLSEACIQLGEAVCTQWTSDLGEWILKKSQKREGSDRFGKPRMVGGLKYNPWEATP